MSETTSGTIGIDEAFAYCERMAREHYENFPVGSLLLPKRLRRHVHSIYAFARIADDIADEGTLPVAERLERLDAWERGLDRALAGGAREPILVALGHTLRERSIPDALLRRLLDAFRMDARNEGFESIDDLLSYCSKSADPVGRLVLHLFDLADERRLALSDRICTGLQIANFLQDLSIDPARGRINIPRESLRRFGYSREELEAGIVNDALRRLVAHHVELAEGLFREGHALLATIPHRRLRLELALTWLGGMRILERIRAAGYDTLSARPSLGWRDALRIGSRALRGRPCLDR